MKTQLLRTSIFALLAAAAVYAESTPELRPPVQGVTNSTIPLTTMAMSLATGASLADMPASTNLAERIQVGPEGSLAAKDPAGQQRSLGLNLPGHVDREKPRVLMAPGGCTHCSNPFSAWQQFQAALSVLYWI